MRKCGFPLAIAALVVTASARAQVTGAVGPVEVHVGTQEMRIRLNGGSPYQALCSTYVEGYFTLVPSGNYTDKTIDALKQKVYLAKMSGGMIDVYSNTSGTRCLITDIVLR